MKRCPFISTMTALFSLIAGMAASSIAVAADVPASRFGEKELSDGWSFRRGGEEWKPVTVPHDWAITGPFHRTNDMQIVRIVENGETNATEKTGRTGSLPWVGTGEYRRRIELPKGAKWASLVFDGVMSEPEVFLDGRKIGEWKFGYSPFEVTLPHSGEVTVKVANRPKSSRWYPGAGIYRPVRLRWGQRIGVPSFGQTILTPDLSTVSVATELRNPEGAKVNVSYRVLDADGRCVADGQSPLKVKNAKPWSPESPVLYTLETVVSVSGETQDIVRERFGFRTISYGEDGFRLNGIKRKFKGVCLHHDLGPLGAAFSKDAFRRQVTLLKEMGCDSIRTAHNTPARGLLEVCDEMGMMVLAESFDSWRRAKCKNGYNLFFDEWWKRDIEQLVKLCRNHPSVIMWSVGNEISEQTTPNGAALYAEMQAYVHSLDAEKGRPVTAGASWMPHAIKSGFVAKMDVPAVTYRLPFYKAIHDASPNKGRMLGIESASTVSSRATYKFPVKVSDWALHPDGQSSGYDVEYCTWSNLPDDDWAMQDDNSWTIGEFVWTGFDYLGEPTPYDDYWPSRSSYFGIFDLAGLPKDRYWLYRSRWNTQSPTLHICPSHWNFKGREGKVTPVYVYTSYPSVELFINGVSQGRRSFDRTSRLDRYRLRWNDVRYAPGEVKTVAYDSSDRIVAEHTVRTAGAVDKVSVSSKRFGNLVFARMTLVDSNGNLVPDDDRTLAIKATGGLAFKAVCNGDPTSLEPFGVPRMKTFRGELVAIGEGVTGSFSASIVE